MVVYWNGKLLSFKKALNYRWRITMLNRIKESLRFRLQYIFRKNAPSFLYRQFVLEDWKRMGGGYIDLDNPTTYCQKQQWAKIYDSDPRKTVLADKVAVREWVKDTIGQEYLIPCFGVYEYPYAIDYSSLPNRFVIKMNHSSHMNLIVKDKYKLDHKKVNNQLKKWARVNFAFPTMELQYKNIQPKVLIEKYIEDKDGELKEYKFFCFKGRVFCSYIMEGRTTKPEGLSMGIMDRDFNLLPVSRKGIKMLKNQPDKPMNYEKMVVIAEKLSANFPHVRVDLYNVDGQIFFGEMTFSSACGFGFYEQQDFDELMGAQWDLPM